MKGIIRISALLWAEILVFYALFVLQKYLTEVWKLSFTHAAGILNIWGGIAFILPVVFLYLIDTVLGNFMMLALSSVAFSMGIGFIAISTPPILANPCKKYEPNCIGLPEKVVFYTGMALLAIGLAGHLVSLKTFLDEQKDNSTNADEGKTSSLSSLFMLVILVPVIGGYFLGKIKQWSILFGIPGICSAVATIAFLSGWRMYKKKEPQGSPLTKIFRVFVASARKRSVNFDPELVQTENNSEPKPLSGTGFLGCLDKAAMTTTDIQDKDIWQFCTVSEIKEAKIVVRMLPICTTFIVCGIVSSIGNTYFAEQANHMSHRINKHKIPTQVLLMLFEWAKALFSSISKPHYKCYPPMMGIGIAMVFSVLCCVTAARIEMIRLNVVRDRGLFDKTGDEIPMSMFWLVFQFILLGGLDSFFENGVDAFVEDVAPEPMRKYMSYFAQGVRGLGFMCGALSVYVVGKISEGVSGKSWFQFTLNKSRLDNYYWVLACLSFVNLLVFIAMASSYMYKNWDGEEKNEEDTNVI